MSNTYLRHTLGNTDAAAIFVSCTSQFLLGPVLFACSGGHLGPPQEAWQLGAPLALLGA